MLAIGEVGCGKQEHRGASDFSMIVVIMNEKNGLFTVLCGLMIIIIIN